MARSPNTTTTGRPFSRATIVSVWQKGRVAHGYDASRYRLDDCGAWIEFAGYGGTSLARGWEIDHVRPVSKGGSDHLSNLQPLNWRNNRHKGDSYPHWTCAVSASR